MILCKKDQKIKRSIWNKMSAARLKIMKLKLKHTEELNTLDDDDSIRLLDHHSNNTVGGGDCWCCFKTATAAEQSSSSSSSSQKIWSFPHNDGYCEMMVNSHYYPINKSSSISNQNHNLITRCQTTTTTSSNYKHNHNPNHNPFAELFSKLFLTLYLLTVIVNSTQADDFNNNNNNWRHRSSSLSNNYKRVRSSTTTFHQSNLPVMNYSSPKIVASPANVGYPSVVGSKPQPRSFGSSSYSSQNIRSSHPHPHHQNHQNPHPHHQSPYYNSQLLSIPFPSTHQLLYQHPEITQNYFNPISSAGSTSVLVHNNPGTQSNQISRNINPLTIMDRTGTNNLIPLKGSKWWDIARHSPMMETMSLDQAPHMDGRHTNSIIPSSSSAAIMSGTSGSQEILSTMNLPLRKKQRKLVRDNPGLLTAISRAMKMAIGECKEQFKDRRWNCPVNDWKKGKNVFGKIIQRGCRETAFVYALTSAAVAHSIARACSEGLIETCTCDFRNNRKPSGIDWEWGGCSDNIDFGYKIARQFVDSAERGRDLRFVMNLHNNEAGRLHISNEMRRECKCHGMSGSCTVKTCWMRLPSFHDVGKNLKDRFDGASRVSMSNEYRGFTRKMMKKVQLKPYETGYKIPTREDLIYFEESPDFCEPNPKYGILGTQGRTCNATSIGVEGCHLLCCGRGYITEEIEEYERCNCTFQWCCQVNCKICKIKKKVFRCK